MAESITITREWFELLEGLPTVQNRWNVLYAVAGFAFDGRVPDDLDALEKSVFMNIKPKIQNRKRVANCYAKRKEKPLESALESALESNGKTLDSTLESNGELPLYIDDGLSNTKKSLDSNSTKTLKENYSFLEEQKTIIQEKVGIAEPKKRKIFVPPTLEEVKVYCKERRNAVNPEEFYAYYQCKDWQVGRTRMKDWRAAVRYWEQKMYEDRKTLSQKRDYSGI